MKIVFSNTLTNKEKVMSNRVDDIEIIKAFCFIYDMSAVKNIGINIKHDILEYNNNKIYILKLEAEDPDGLAEEYKYLYSKAKDCFISIDDIVNNKELKSAIHIIGTEDKNNIRIPEDKFYEVIEKIIEYNKEDMSDDEELKYSTNALNVIKDTVASISLTCKAACIAKYIKTYDDDTANELFNIIDTRVDEALHDVTDKVEKIIMHGMYIYTNEELGIGILISGDGKFITTISGTMIDLDDIIEHIKNQKNKSDIESKVKMLHAYVYNIAVNTQEIRNEMNNTDTTHMTEQ